MSRWHQRDQGQDGQGEQGERVEVAQVQSTSASASTSTTSDQNNPGPRALPINTTGHPNDNNNNNGGNNSSPPSPTSSSFTFTSSMNYSAFREDEGRLYNASQDDYALPADLQEIQRLDIQHHALKLFLGANYPPHVGEFLRSSGPNGEEMRILDLGCGTGRWCLEMATEFPGAEIIGLDLVPIQSDTPLPNLSLIMDDMTHGLPFPDTSFDLVTGRFLLAGIRDYPAVMREVGRVLRPGGMVLSTEPEMFLQVLTDDGSVYDTEQTASIIPGLKAWESKLHIALRARGLDPFLSHSLSAHIRSTGMFDNISTRTGFWPMTSWSDIPALSSCGTLMLRDMKLFPEASRLLIIDGAGVSSQEFDRISRDFEADLIHAEEKKVVWKLWLVSGRRI